MESMLSAGRVTPHPSLLSDRGALRAEVADAQESSNLRFWTLIDAVRVQVHQFLMSLFSRLSARAPAGHDPVQLIGALLSGLSEERMRAQAELMLDALDGVRFEAEYSNAAVYIVRRVMVQESPEFCSALERASSPSASSDVRAPQLDVSLDEPIVFLTRCLKQAITSPEVVSGEWFVSGDMAARVDAIKNAVVRAMMSSASGEYRVQSVMQRRREAVSQMLASSMPSVAAAPSASTLSGGVARRAPPPSLSALAASRAPLPTLLQEVLGADVTGASVSAPRAPSRLVSIPTVGASALLPSASRSEIVSVARSR